MMVWQSKKKKEEEYYHSTSIKASCAFKKKTNICTYTRVHQHKHARTRAHTHTHIHLMLDLILYIHTILCFLAVILCKCVTQGVHLTLITKIEGT
jgi:hypothetical protein